MTPPKLLPLLGVALAVLAPWSAAVADVKLPAIFSDRLVLQAGKPVPIWGWAAEGEEVTVTFAGQTQKAQAGEGGRWKVTLAPLSASTTPATLTVKGLNTIPVKDVLVGEVWLGSGQSNMAMRVSNAKDFEQEKAAARYPNIRIFTVGGSFSEKPVDDCLGGWIECSPESVGMFSATSYFFGREIHQKLSVPVGLINSSVGGTPIDAWIAEDAQRASPELKPLLDEIDKEDATLNPTAAKAAYMRELAAWEEKAKEARASGKPVPRRPQDISALREKKNNLGGLFNGKIAGLIPFAIRGVLWYQGEANTVPLKAPYYQHHLPLLVQDWRKRWGEELPFAWVQLPNFAGRGEGWCVVREAMLKSLKLPNTGMAIALDLGDTRDIHPKNKQEVGRRLSLWALGEVYAPKKRAEKKEEIHEERPAEPKLEISGPLYEKHVINGPAVVVTFSHAEGLMAKNGVVQEIEIAGEDQKWHPARALIDGSQIIVTSDAVPKPAAVRYAWKDDPVATLYNAAGLPASPFRTDDWPIVFPDPVADRRKAVEERAAKSNALPPGL